MAFLMRAALIEYGSDFLGPLPNVVIFQFNPENVVRNIQIPPRPTGAAARETSQAGDPPVERFTLRAEFDASDELARSNPIAVTNGIGPQLAALEKMVRPTNIIGAAIVKALDKIGDTLGVGSSKDPPEQAIPREKYPRILFIWGLTRVLPVVIESMTITEQQYDFLLNPVRAEVSIGMAVYPIDRCSDDAIARGALQFTDVAKEAQAIINLANTVQQSVELIPF